MSYLTGWALWSSSSPLKKQDRYSPRISVVAVVFRCHSPQLSHLSYFYRSLSSPSHSSNVVTRQISSFYMKSSVSALVRLLTLLNSLRSSRQLTPSTPIMPISESWPLVSLGDVGARHSIHPLLHSTFPRVKRRSNIHESEIGRTYRPLPIAKHFQVHTRLLLRIPAPLVGTILRLGDTLLFHT